MKDFLTEPDILGMHSILIARYGGLDGVRDSNSLKSAVFRPQSGYYNDIIEEACALMESLLINHPFIDGNKRIAYAAGSVFLKLHGKKINAQPKEIHKIILGWLELAPEKRFGQMVDDLRKLTTEPSKGN